VSRDFSQFYEAKLLEKFIRQLRCVLKSNLQNTCYTVPVLRTQNRYGNPKMRIFYQGRVSKTLHLQPVKNRLVLTCCALAVSQLVFFLVFYRSNLLAHGFATQAAHMLAALCLASISLCSPSLIPLGGSSYRQVSGIRLGDARLSMMWDRQLIENDRMVGFLRLILIAIALLCCFLQLSVRNCRRVSLASDLPAWHKG